MDKKYLPSTDDLNACAKHVAEEALELSMAALKADRFGHSNCHPNTPEEDNGDAMIREFEDLTNAFRRWADAMKKAGLVSE